MNQLHYGDNLQVLREHLADESGIMSLSMWSESDRASRFRRRCQKAGVSGVTLHSYRYAWAERAKVVGMPERFAQAALGHNSKAIHRAYAKKAVIIAPSLEDYEKKAAALTTAVAA
jgi:integrase